MDEKEKETEAIRKMFAAGVQSVTVSTGTDIRSGRFPEAYRVMVYGPARAFAIGGFMASSGLIYLASHYVPISLPELFAWSSVTGGALGGFAYLSFHADFMRLATSLSSTTYTAPPPPEQPRMVQHNRVGPVQVKRADVRLVSPSGRQSFVFTGKVLDALSKQGDIRREGSGLSGDEYKRATSVLASVGYVTKGTRLTMWTDEGRAWLKGAGLHSPYPNAPDAPKRAI